jgi:preprotein translocase subunit SecF
MLRLIPDDTSINFMKSRFVALAVSVALMVGSLALFAVNGLNLGIDFKGGISIEIGAHEPIDVALVRSVLSDLNLGDVKVQEFGKPENAMIRIERQIGGEDEQGNAILKVQEALEKIMPEVIPPRSTSSIGPTVSGELAVDGTKAIVFAVIAVMIYIWLRFEWQFGLGAVLALAHDIILTIGFFAVTRLEFNLSIIAALLTIVGYSLNDTVVVYDRVRENIRKFRKREVKDVVNLSLNQTLSRTIMTSLTTLIALLALYFFGGQAVTGFTAAMIWGVFVGTYSSVFIAAPMLLFLKVESSHLIPDEDRSSSKEKA